MVQKYKDKICFSGKSGTIQNQDWSWFPAQLLWLAPSLSELKSPHVWKMSLSTLFSEVVEGLNSIMHETCLDPARPSMGRELREARKPEWIPPAAFALLSLQASLLEPSPACPPETSFLQ